MNSLTQLLNDAHKLRRGDVQWQVSVCKAPAWVDDGEGGRYRPHLVLVVTEDTQHIRQSVIQGEPFTPEQVLELVLQGMLEPKTGSGVRYRPTQIVINHGDSFAYMHDILAGILVDVYNDGRLPLADLALYEMEKYMQDQKPIAALVRSPDLSLVQVEAFFAAGYRFYQERIWEIMSYQRPFFIRDEENGRQGYGTVLGSDGDVYGLVLYETLADLRAVYLHGDDAKVPQLAILFGGKERLAFADLDALERFKWPIGDALGYPRMMRVDTDYFVHLPTVDELEWGTAVLDHLTRWLLEPEELPDFWSIDVVGESYERTMDSSE